MAGSPLVTMSARLWSGLIMSRSMSGSTPKTLSTSSSICLCWPVDSANSSSSAEPFIASTTGIIFIVSGLVPKTAITFFFIACGPSFP